MLNTTLFTSGSAVSLFVRDRRRRETVRVMAILSAAEAKIRFVISFILTPSSEDNLDASDRCVACRVVDITPGARGWWENEGEKEREKERGSRKGVACPVSGCGIARDISPPPRSQFSSHKWPSPTTTVFTTPRSLTPLLPSTALAAFVSS